MEESQNTYLTAEGIKKLHQELEYLINIRRPEIARQIAEAKADGDVSENAGYDEAKNAQAFAEGRILTLKNILANAVVINENVSKDTVELGAKVTVRDTRFGGEETYTIVGSTEVDPPNGRISLRSPLGKALMGHRIGDLIQFQAPGGNMQFEVVRIS